MRPVQVTNDRVCKRNHRLLGQALNRDPIAEGGGINLYVMVYNCPISYIDPLGLGDNTHWPTPQPGKGFKGTPWRGWDPPPIVVMPPGDLVMATEAGTFSEGGAAIPALLWPNYDDENGTGAGLGFSICLLFNILSDFPSRMITSDQLSWDSNYGSPPPGQTWLVPPRPITPQPPLSTGKPPTAPPRGGYPVGIHRGSNLVR